MVLLLSLLLLALVLTRAEPARAASSSWEFNQDGDTEGWRFNNGIVDPTVAQGALDFNVSGGDPWMVSQTVSIPAAENNVVVIRMKNGTANGAGRIYWATEQSPNLSQDKSKSFGLVTNAPGSFTEYRVDMRGAAAWAGNITQLRVDPADNSKFDGPMSIDYIRFEFNNEPLPDPTAGDRKPVPHIGEVSEVAADDAVVSVRGSVDDPADIAGRTLDLYELAPFQYEPDYEKLTPIATEEGPVEGAEFGFSVPRYDGGRDRYHSKFLVVARDPSDQDAEPGFVDAPKYVTDTRFAAEHQYPYPAAISKKGLQVQMVDDAEELGIGHAALNVEFEDMMLLQNLDPEGTIAYEVDGKEYYFDKSYVEALDAEVKSLSDNDIIVNLILILYDQPKSNSALEKLIHPDAARGQGTVYAFDTATSEGVEYVRAAMEFVTDRYTREDERYGRAVGYIVGNEVDSQQNWYNMGPKTLNQFMDNYERTVHLVYQAARKHYDNPRVYISLTHFWNAQNGSDPLYSYKVRDVIDKMDELSDENGDYPWHVASHPYPENLADPTTWDDRTATDSFDTMRVTFKNLHILPQYLQQERFLYAGEQRRIILSEQGFNTPDLSDRSQALQAAGYAYAYYKTLFEPSIDSFILHRHVDHKREGGLRLGLWSWDETRPEPSSPDRQKAIYEVFKKVDTAESLGVTEFAKPIIGIQDWREVIPNFDETKLAVREAPSPVGTSFIKKPVDARKVTDFEGSTGGWEKAENAQSVQLNTTDAYRGSGALQVNFDALAKLWRGADVEFDEPVDATTRPHLNLALKLPSYEAEDDYYAKVKVYDGQRVAEGVAALTKGDWNHVSLDLSGWGGLGSVDRVQVWVQSHTNKDWRGTVLIDAVSFSSRVVPKGGHANMDVAAVADRLAVGETVEVRVTNHDTKALEDAVALKPSSGISFDRSALDVDGLEPGESKTFPLTITKYSGAATEAPVYVGYRYQARLLDRAIRVGGHLDSY